jgi:hypothetical protein
MRITLRKMFVVLLILLAMADLAKAEEASFTISCTIPAIPGLNAPLIVEEKPQTNVANPAPTTTVKSQTETQEQAPAMIQEEQKERKTSENQDTLVIVKTVYSR